ncbi:MAG: hypothetical protein ACREA2_16780 [Blastocatellia bacterium]
MDAFNRFTFEDFLAYFFPGAVGSLGLYLLLLLTPLRPQMARLSIDVSTGLILLVWSYTFGVIIAGFASPMLKLLRWLRRIGPRVPLVIPLSDLKSDFEQDVIKAYRTVFKVDNSTEVKWSREFFYLSRSLVENWMPIANQLIRRQVSLRRVRENLLPCIIIWCSAGIGWGYKWFSLGEKVWGIALASLSLIMLLFVGNALATSLDGNCKREAQEVCVALVVGSHTGLFEKQDKKTDPPKGG